MALKWQGKEEMAADVLRRKENFRAATVVLGHSHAARGESAMKKGAPWKDQTTNARQGLYGVCESNGDGITIELGGTMDYQQYLELGTSLMEPREIIWPTAETTARELAEDAIKLAQRFGG